VMSVGSLGAVLEMDLELVPEFHVEKSTRLMSLPKALSEFHASKHTELGISLAGGLMDITPAQVLKSEVTTKAITKPACCYNYWSTVPQDDVMNFVEDFKYDPAAEPVVAKTTHCEHNVLQVYELAAKGVNVPAMSVDINIKPDDVKKTLKLIKDIKWTEGTDLLMRWILKDTKDVLLSPYHDGDRVSLDISQHLAWKPTETTPVQDWETKEFQQSIKTLIKKLKEANIQIRYHVGKNGFQTIHFWDYSRLEKFQKVKAKNDPKGLFTNEWYEVVKHNTANPKTLKLRESRSHYVLQNKAYGYCYEASNAGAEKYLWDCVRNGFPANKKLPDEKWDLHRLDTDSADGKSCNELGFDQHMGIGPPYKRMDVEVFTNPKGSAILAPVFNPLTGQYVQRTLDMIGKVHLAKGCVDGAEGQYP
jgi:hypothetical protein